MERKELKRTRRSKILIKARCVDDLLSRSDINYVVERLNKDKARFQGLVVIGITKDNEVEVTTSGLNFIESLGALQAGVIQVSSVDYQEYNSGEQKV